MGAATRYAALIDAVQTQRLRVQSGQTEPDFWGRSASRFRADPRREMDSNFEAIAAYVEPEDVFIDAGGGAGRFSLPMALRCREVINVEPSHGMGVEFQSSATEAGIANATFIHSDWLNSVGVEGDVSLSAHVTYFVGDIERFIQNLESAARRRVIIVVSSIPPPNHFAKVFQLVYGEQLERSPGHTDLLPVLWEMGILPDVVVLPNATTNGCVPVEYNLPQTPQDAVDDVMGGVWLNPADTERARKLISGRLDEFFHQGPEGFTPSWRPTTQQMLITWENEKQSWSWLSGMGGTALTNSKK